MKSERQTTIEERFTIATNNQFSNLPKNSIIRLPILLLAGASFRKRNSRYELVMPIISNILFTFKLKKKYEQTIWGN